MGNSRASFFVFCFAASALIMTELCAGAFAQGLTGQISGLITDSSGGSIANATVQVVNAQTSQSRLQLGSVNETIAVQGQVAAVQTESTERAGLITGIFMAAFITFSATRIKCQFLGAWNA